MLFILRATSVVSVLAIGANAIALHVGCKAFPGDSVWPAKSLWDAFNTTVGGRLVATVPVGSPCHDPHYDEARCNALRSSWTNPFTHIESSSSFMQTYFTDSSCDPWTERTSPCELGRYVVYSVRVRDASDVAKTVKFAKDKNIRLVIKNTGHDFFGRSSGAGSLAVWTRDLKDIKFSTFSDEYYTGESVTVGAGVLGHEMLQAAHTQGRTVLTGECPSVGLVGGFTQGGGHSALSHAFGLGADQTLEFEVVTAAGTIVKASATENADLYWALSGGGGGNYGIVTSVTVRVHPGELVGSGGFVISSAAVTLDQFRAAPAIVNKHLATIIDQGAIFIYAIRKEYLAVSSVAVWNSTAEHIRDNVMADLVAELENEGITLLRHRYQTLANRDYHNEFIGALPAGIVPVANHQQGGRFLPRHVLEQNHGGFSNALNTLSANGAYVLVTAGNFAKRFGPDNAVLPEWRHVAAQVSVIAQYNNSAGRGAIEAAQRRVTNRYMPELKSITPNAKAYMNEADFSERGWQNLFYGRNYVKLLAIKKKWDPKSFFYVYKGVGSEVWKTKEDGRLCAWWKFW